MTSTRTYVIYTYIVHDISPMYHTYTCIVLKEVTNSNQLNYLISAIFIVNAIDMHIIFH